MVLVVMGAFFSCTNEEGLDRPDYVATTAEITLNMGKVSTKADPGYVAGSIDELSVTTGYVIVFELETVDGTQQVGKMIEVPKFFETKDIMQTTTDKNELGIAYKLSGIPVIVGKHCRLFVIANTTLDLKKITTYEALLDQVESYTAASDFGARKLVKVGYADVTVAMENPNVEVPMTQLAAKVNVTVQMGNDWVASAGSEYSWVFEPTSGFTVNNINTKTDLMLVDDFVNTKSVDQTLPESSQGTDGKWGNSHTFYTYEKTNQAGMKHLEVILKGKIHQYKNGTLFYSQEESEYKLTLDDSAVTSGEWNGFQHGNYYDVVAKLSPGTMKLEYELTVKSWGDPKAIHVEPYYLYVKDLKLLMPSTTTHSTTYNSSPDLDPNEGVKVIRVVELAPDVLSGQVAERELSPEDEATLIDLITVTFNSTTKEINISSPLPDNYIGRRFTIEVKNSQGLTQEVVVDQYPPFYFDSKTTGSPIGSSFENQDNPCMYIINTLVTDFKAGLPTVDQIDELMEYHEWIDAKGKNPNKHDPSYHTTPEQFKALATERLTYLREIAVSGYPLVETDGTYETINTEENNRRISPRFMLASQAGITNSMNYTFDDWEAAILGGTSAKTRCREYTEIEQGVGVHSDWRVPTLAELILIDVIQNVKSSSVKEILEGSYYWSGYAVWGSYLDKQDGSSRTEAMGPAIRFMDNRTGNGKTEVRAPVRCVRDLK